MPGCPDGRAGWATEGRRCGATRRRNDGPGRNLHPAQPLSGRRGWRPITAAGLIVANWLTVAFGHIGGRTALLALALPPILAIPLLGGFGGLRQCPPSCGAVPLTLLLTAGGMARRAASWASRWPTGGDAAGAARPAHRLRGAGARDFAIAALFVASFIAAVLSGRYGARHCCGGCYGRHRACSPRRTSRRSSAAACRRSAWQAGCRRRTGPVSVADPALDRAAAGAAGDRAILGQQLHRAVQGYVAHHRGEPVRAHRRPRPRPGRRRGMAAFYLEVQLFLAAIYWLGCALLARISAIMRQP